MASGHVASFSDPLIDCKQCKARHRADKMIEDYNIANGIDMVVDGMSNEAMTEYINEKIFLARNAEGINSQISENLI